jgi:hypothetical protein
VEDDVTDGPVREGEAWAAAITYLAEQVVAWWDPERRDGNDDALAFLDAVDAAAKPRGFRLAMFVVPDGSELIVDQVPVTLDDELVTIKRCWNALTEVDAPAALRVSQYLVERFKPEVVE